MVTFFLLNKNTEKVKFPPIYDCGSALNPILEDKEIEKINETELKNLAINCYSCLKENGKKNMENMKLDFSVKIANEVEKAILFGLCAKNEPNEY